MGSNLDPIYSLDLGLGKSDGYNFDRIYFTKLI